MEILERLSGLSDADPIHRHLKVVSRFMKGHDWSYINCQLSRDSLIFLLSGTIGGIGEKVQEQGLDALEIQFEAFKEKVFLEILQKLRRSEVDSYGIKVVLFWLVANLELIKEAYLEGKHYRQLNDDWQPAW